MEDKGHAFPLSNLPAHRGMVRCSGSATAVRGKVPHCLGGNQGNGANSASTLLGAEGTDVPATGRIAVPTMTCSSEDRALAYESGCRRFDPCHVNTLR